jgi:hypothetical protein
VLNSLRVVVACRAGLETTSHVQWVLKKETAARLAEYSVWCGSEEARSGFVVVEPSDGSGFGQSGEPLVAPLSASIMRSLCWSVLVAVTDYLSFRQAGALGPVQGQRGRVFTDAEVQLVNVFLAERFAQAALGGGFVLGGHGGSPT